MELTKRGGVPVELRDLRKNFGGVAALEGFNLVANPGEFVVMLGPSGCGKTTALRALAGLERIDSGEVRIGGVDVTSLPTERRSIGMVFQNYSLFPNMTSRANVEFGLRVRGVNAKDRRAKSAELLDLVGLSSAADRYPHQLSGGQQQRIAIARALAIEPEVLLLDEPLSALDAKVRAQLRDEIKRIQRELGITTFFVTHDQEEALALADRIAVMNSGHLEQYGTPDVVYGRPATNFVTRFVGHVNIFDGTMSAVGVEVGGLGTISVSHLTDVPRIGDEAEVFVRPESFELKPSAVGEFVVDGITFLGGYVRASVTRGSQSVTVTFVPSNDSAVSLGERVDLRCITGAVFVRSKSTLSEVDLSDELAALQVDAS